MKEKNNNQNLMMQDSIIIIFISLAYCSYILIQKFCKWHYLFNTHRFSAARGFGVLGFWGFGGSWGPENDWRGFQEARTTLGHKMTHRGQKMTIFYAIFSNQIPVNWN